MLTELFRDRRLVIIDKPAGLPVHAGPRGGASVEDHFPSLTRKPHGPWLVHRLDADTSGCLAIALTKTALVQAQSAFAEGLARKTYWAIVRGKPKTTAGMIDAPLLKTNTRTGWRMEINQSGDRAVSEWRVLASDADITLLEMQPRTGRTHQVRVHCASLGCPIEGDPIYGDGNGKLALLARALMLPLVPEIAAQAPLPPHMLELLNNHPLLVEAATRDPRKVS
jgi:tRNA pseudouridine32 synthase/23S rRNA pseudouridine746 synthase